VLENIFGTRSGRRKLHIVLLLNLLLSQKIIKILLLLYWISTKKLLVCYNSQNNVVDTAITLETGRGKTVVWFLARGKKFCLPQNVQTRKWNLQGGYHTAATKGCFPSFKLTHTWSYSLLCLHSVYNWQVLSDDYLNILSFTL